MGLKRICFLLVHLHTVGAVVCNVHGATIYAHRHGPADALLGFERSHLPQPERLNVGLHVVMGLFRQCGVALEKLNKHAIRSEQLHPVIRPVSDVYVAVGVNSDTRRTIELALPISGTCLS